MMETSTVELLNSDQAAELLRIHPKTLQRLARKGVIPAIRIGKLWRFRVCDLDKWLTARVSSLSHPCR